MLKPIITATAAIGLMATPALAQENAAERLAAPVESSEMLDGENGILIAVIAAAAVIAGIIILSDDDDEDVDDPVSP